MSTVFAFYDVGQVFAERERLDGKFDGAWTRQEVEAIYRDLAKAAHPDAGGTNQQMYELNEAKARALLRIRNRALLVHKTGGII